MNEAVKKKNIITEGTIWVLTLITAIPFLLLFSKGVNEVGLIYPLLTMASMVVFSVLFSRSVMRFVKSYCDKRGIAISNEPKSVVMNYSGTPFPTLIIKLSRVLSSVGLSVIVWFLCVNFNHDYKILTVLSSFLFFSAIQGRDITVKQSIRNGVSNEKIK